MGGMCMLVRWICRYASRLTQSGMACVIYMRKRVSGGVLRTDVHIFLPLLCLNKKSRIIRHL